MNSSQKGKTASGWLVAGHATLLAILVPAVFMMFLPIVFGPCGPDCSGTARLLTPYQWISFKSLNADFQILATLADALWLYSVINLFLFYVVKKGSDAALAKFTFVFAVFTVAVIVALISMGVR